MFINKILRKILYPHTYSSEAFVAFLKKSGVRIGTGTYFFDPNSNSVDIQRPHMLVLGEYVKVTRGVVILTHDFSRSVLSGIKDGVNVADCGETIIGNNVFIGVNSIVLMGTKIGNNCIVGAGSVLRGTFPDNSVLAGNPARVICSLDAFYEKRKAKELEGAVLYVKCFWERMGRYPKEQEMTNAFCWMYGAHSKENAREKKSFFTLHGVDQELYLENYLKTTPLFLNFDAFMDYCKGTLSNERVG